MLIKNLILGGVICDITKSSGANPGPAGADVEAWSHQCTNTDADIEPTSYLLSYLADNEILADK